MEAPHGNVIQILNIVKDIQAKVDMLRAQTTTCELSPQSQEKLVEDLRKIFVQKQVIYNHGSNQPDYSRLQPAINFHPTEPTTVNEKEPLRLE